MFSKITLMKRNTLIRESNIPQGLGILCWFSPPWRHFHVRCTFLGLGMSYERVRVIWSRWQRLLILPDSGTSSLNMCYTNLHLQHVLRPFILQRAREQSKNCRKYWCGGRHDNSNIRCWGCGRGSISTFTKVIRGKSERAGRSKCIICVCL